MSRTRLLRNTAVALAAAGVCVFATVTAGYGSPVFPSLVPMGVDIVETKQQYETQQLAQKVGRAAAFTVAAAVAAVVAFALFLRASRRAQTAA